MGPLDGVTIVELAGLGPGPFCGMVLADLGARVVPVDRPGDVAGLPGDPPVDVLERGKRSIALDLEQAAGVEVFLRLAETADAVIDPFRPGTAERLGVGPGACGARNPALVHGHMTGWGQDGPCAAMARHDIDYIAITGLLHAIGRRGGPPAPPLNVVGDFGGGEMLLAIGLLAGILHARASGDGQVVEAAMIDGAALLSAIFFGSTVLGEWRHERGSNLTDSGAPFYDVYRAADGRYIAVGAIEPRFYAELLKGLGLDGDEQQLLGQYDRARRRELRERIAAALSRRSAADWVELLDGTDACVAPVLSFDEAPAHPQNRARDVYVEVAGRLQPRPAPRFGRTPAAVRGPAPHAGQHTRELIAELGYDAGEAGELLRSGAARIPDVTTSGGETP